MANTLYDILEVSPVASAETITANFKRLLGKFGSLAANGDEEATNRMIALKEAYRTLSDPGRRQRYDDGLAIRASMVDQSSPGYGRSLVWVILIIALGFIGFVTQKHLAEQERLRLQAEQTAAALRLAEIEAKREREERLAAQQEEQRQRQVESMERIEQERAMAYGKQIARDAERAEERERQQQERERQQRVQAERQRQLEAERQLAREKAYLRQLETENRRQAYY